MPSSPAPNTRMFRDFTLETVLFIDFNPSKIQCRPYLARRDHERKKVHG